MVIVGHGLYDNSIPTDRGILVIAGAVVICGLVTTLMEIKLSLSNISDSAYNTKVISLATYNLLDGLSLSYFLMSILIEQ